MSEPLQFLWPAVEAVNPVFSRAALIRWPNGVHAQLVSARLLVPDGTTTRIRCPECGNTHVATPISRQSRDGSSRVFIPCPQHLRAEVNDRDIQRWTANTAELAQSLSTALGLGGKVAKLASDRVWRCGRWTHQGVLRDILFARGLRRHDAAQFRRAITGSHRPIVFVGSEFPGDGFWQGKAPPQIRLREVAALVDGQIQLDLDQIVGLVRAVDEARGAGGPITLDQLTSLVRTQVKAEGKMVLRDDWLIAAYKQYGSYRKTAEFLSAEAEQTVSRYQVERAVKRAGGPEAVMREDDSESVVRTVSSRRRDTPIENRDSRK